MPEYLYKVTPAREGMVADPTPREEEVVGEHFAWLKTQTEQGIVLIVGRTQTTGPETFGITIFRAASDEHARDFMNQDPAVKNGVMRAEVFPYKVALMAATTLDEWRKVSG
jgi:uncharacterized protein YciI